MEDNFKDYINCIKSLKLELQSRIDSGEKWVLISTDSSLTGTEACPVQKTGRASEPPKPVLPPKHAPASRPPEPYVQKSAPAVPVREPVRREFDSQVQKKEKGAVVVVRLCPTEAELKNGIPYSDDGGKLIDEALTEAGFKPDNIYKTYLCRFHLDYLPENAPEITKWKNDFLEEMDNLKPSMIACFGERVSRIISNTAKPIDELRKMKMKIRECRLFLFYDPMYLAKKKELKSVLVSELKKQ